jgi:hydroxypyruvate reductase
VLSLILSDVVGDPLDVIGSGPTAPDPSTYSEAKNVLHKFDAWARVPASVRERIEEGAAGNIPETPKPGDPIFGNTQNLIVCSNRLALDAAAEAARSLGYRPLILSSFIEGETREIARMHAAIAREAILHGSPIPPPACLISGGETTVSIRGSGKGGRNQEFALAAALDISGLENVLILSAGTDGTDGPTDAAGAVCDGFTIARAIEKGLDPQASLDNNDSYQFFDALGDLIRTGPTGTNVMDVRLMLVGQPGAPIN